MLSSMLCSYGVNDLSTLSNVVFSNGLLDPWHAAGVVHNISGTVKAVVMPGAAHHQDLMFSHPEDPPSVEQARQFEFDNIQRWVDQANAAGKHWP